MGIATLVASRMRKRKGGRHVSKSDGRTQSTSEGRTPEGRPNSSSSSGSRLYEVSFSKARSNKMSRSTIGYSKGSK